MKRRFRFVAVLVLLAIVAAITLAAVTSVASEGTGDGAAEERLRVISEETGMVASERRLSPACEYDPGYELYLCPEPAPAFVARRDPAAAARAAALLDSAGLLLIPDSTNDRVMAFDPVTGDLVDANFIPTDSTNLSTPVDAILSAGRDTILVSDQLEDVVQEYDLDGNYLGVFAPAGGPDPAILDNVRGIALRPNGNLLVTVGSGTNADAVAEFDTAGNYLGNFVAVGSGGLDSPYDPYGRSADWLVGGSTSDAIHRYDLAGSYIGNLTAIDSFPEQIAGAANGNILVGNFSGAEEGVVEYTPSGVLVGIYDPASIGGYRGVYELPNGNILTTTGTGVYEINRAGVVVSTKISGLHARFIEYLPPAGPDLALVKSAAPGEAAPGDTVTYFIEFSYTDVPTGTATGVVVTDVVPIYLANVGWASSGATITPTGGISYAWEVDDLVPGAAGVITITGQVSPGLAAGFVFTNTASITSSLSEGNLDNNADDAPVTLLNAPPVAVDDAASTLEEQPVTISVLDNDGDPNGDLLHVVSTSTPAHGTATTDGTTVTYTPTLNFAGTDVLTYTIADPGGLTDTATVSVIVSPTNDPPTISEIADQVIYEDTSTGPITFTIYDEETPAGDLALSATSSNPPLAPIDQIVFAGSGMTRTVTVTPTAGMIGTSTITITVSDGTEAASEAFLLTVLDKFRFDMYLPLVRRGEP